MIDGKLDAQFAKGLEKKIKSLGTRWAKNASRRALRKGANIIKDDAKARTEAIDDPETAEMIYRNIAVRNAGAKKERKAGGAMVQVGIMGGARPLSKDDASVSGLPGKNTTHWRFVEYGTSQARAQPFMRPAMEEKAEAASSEITRALARELDREAKRRL